MVFNVRDRLPGLRPVASVSAEMDSGFIVLMVCNKARLSSLRISASDFIDVNQTFGSPGLGLYSPRAMVKARSRIFFRSEERRVGNEDNCTIAPWIYRKWK